MVRALASALALLIVLTVALLMGLAGTTLRTGWIDPLDWLAPGVAALALLALAFARDASPRRIAGLCALVALAPAVLLVMAGALVPWAGLALLVGGIALAGVAVAGAARLGRAGRILAGAAIVVAAWAGPRAAEAWRPVAVADGGGPVVGVLSGVPLYGPALGAARGRPPLDSAGLRSPLWRLLETRVRPRALDALDEAGLRGLSALLLVQPRSLAPEELVALDAWVRGGGRALILADPLLRWPDPRPLADPARAPLTSLLDPLLAHWGLQLEPAPVADAADPVERRLLASGALVQLAGASRFVAAGAARDCAPEEAGLLARCRIGRGEALLVADADWIDDALWTLDPDAPAARAHRTSDAPELLAAWLAGATHPVGTRGTWLADEAALVEGLRAALVALLLAVAGRTLVAARPRRSHPSFETDRDQKWNIGKTELDTT